MIFFSIIVILLLFFLCISINSHGKKKLFCIITTVFLILISGLRSISVGFDTESYLSMLKNANSISWHNLMSNFFLYYLGSDYSDRDPGFIVFEKMILAITSNEQLYLIIIATICIVPISILIYKYSRDIKSELMAYLYFVFFYFSYIPNSAIRQALALSFLLLGYNSLDKNKLTRCLLCVFIASTIHKSAILFLLFVVFYKLNLHKLLFKYGLIIFGFFLLFYESVAPFISLFGDVYSEYGSSDYFSSTQRSYSFIIFIVLIYLMTLIPLITNRDKDFEKYKNFYLGSAMALFFTPFMLITPTILRITVYFAVFNLVLIPHSLSLYKQIGAKVIYIALITLFLVLSSNTDMAYYFYWVD